MIHVEDRTASQKGMALVGDCCRLPFGYFRKAKLILTMAHSKRQHEIELTANDLRSLANLLDWMAGIRPK